MKYFISILLLLVSGYSLAQAETLSARVIKYSASNKIVLLNRGFNDGLEKHDRAKFYKGQQAVAKGKLIKIKASRSIWKLTRTYSSKRLASAKNIKLRLPASQPLARSQRLSYKQKKASKNGFSQFQFGISSQQTDNRFKLSTTSQNRLESGSEANGRYQNMESVNDLSVVPKVKYSYSLTDSTKLQAQGKYHLMTQNSSASYAEIEGALSHSLGAGDKLKFSGEALLGYFPKNYFSGAIDSNNNGNISSEERIYSEARYDEYKFELAYKNRIWKNSRRRIFLTPFAGYLVRAHQDPFGNRDRNTLFVGGQAEFEVKGQMALFVEYKLEDLATGDANELTLVNETSSGANGDLNGDGLQSENAALITKVDRSRTRNTISLGGHYDFSDSFRFGLKYSIRTGTYNTDNSLDTEHHQAEESRNTLESQLRMEITKQVDLSLGHEVVDDNDFQQTNTKLSLQYRFGS